MNSKYHTNPVRWPDLLDEQLTGRLAPLGVKAFAYNFGYAGDTAADGLSRWSTPGYSTSGDRAAPLDQVSDAIAGTDVSVIGYGYNDAVWPGDLASFLKNIQRMIDRELIKVSIPVLLVQPLAEGEDYPGDWSILQGGFRSWIRERDWLAVDLEHELPDIDRRTTDGLHFSAEMNRAVAALLVAKLTAWLGIPAR